MKEDLLDQGVLTDSSAGVGPVTYALVRARTRELALIAGRAAQQVSRADYEQAKRELTGESDPDRQDAVLNALPEEEGRDPMLRPTARPGADRAADECDRPGPANSRSR